MLVNDSDGLRGVRLASYLPPQFHPSLINQAQSVAAIHKTFLTSAHNKHARLRTNTLCAVQVAEPMPVSLAQRRQGTDVSS